MANLKAHSEWKSRPADERHWDFDSAIASAEARQNISKDYTIPMHSLRAMADGESIKLACNRDSGVPASMTHWAFGQLCAQLKAPADYLRRCGTELAAMNINHGLRQMPVDATTKAYVARNGITQIRAMTSDGYARVHNSELLRRAKRFTEHGWETPLGRWNGDESVPRRVIQTESELRPYQINLRVGDEICPSGIYESDRSMFFFLVHPQRDANGLYAAFMGWNSEVGYSSIGGLFFHFNCVCGNHIIHGMTGQREFRYVHRGNTGEKSWAALRYALNTFAEHSTGEFESAIRVSRTLELGKNQDEVIETTYNRLNGRASRAEVLAAYKTAEEFPQDHNYASPRSIWGIVNGATRYSQSLYADERKRVDMAFGSLLKSAN